MTSPPDMPRCEWCGLLHNVGACAEPEVVAAAAVRAGDGKVWWLQRPCRHCHVMHAMWQAYGDARPREEREVQGFITTAGRFVDRNEAMRIAVERGQPFKDEPRYTDTLFSEDLW